MLRVPAVHPDFGDDNDDDFPRSTSDVSTSGIRYQATPDHERLRFRGPSYPTTTFHPPPGYRDVLSKRVRELEDERERETREEKTRAMRELQQPRAPSPELNYEDSYDSYSTYEGDSDDLVPSDEEGPNLRTQRYKPVLAPIPPQLPRWGPTQQGARAFVELCNKDTISKDNTIGEEARMNDLMARVGRKMMRSPRFHKLQAESAGDSRETHRSSDVRRDEDARRMREEEVRRQEYEEIVNRHFETSWPVIPSRPFSPSDENTEDVSTEYGSTDESGMTLHEIARRRRRRQRAEAASRYERDERIRSRIAEANAKRAAQPVAPDPPVPQRYPSGPYGSGKDKTEGSSDIDYRLGRISPWDPDQILNTPSEHYRQEHEPDEHVWQHKVDGGRSRLKISQSRKYDSSDVSYGQYVLENPETGSREYAYA